MITTISTSFLDGLGAGSAVVDGNLNVRYWNSWLEVYTGIRREDILGKKISDVLNDIDVKTLERKVRSVFVLKSPAFYDPTITPYLFRVSLNKITKSIYQYMCQSVCILPFDLDHGLVSIMIYDQTPLLEAKARLNKQNEEFRQLNEHLEERVAQELAIGRQKDYLLIQRSRQAAMGEMIGAIAHQWKQPLNALGILVEDLIFKHNNKILADKVLEDDLSEASELIEFMSKTVDDFRGFFKPNKTKKPFSISRAISQIVHIVEHQFKDKNITIIKKYKEDDYAFETNGFDGEFKQAILNILSNAKDALMENNVTGATVEIDIYSDADGKICITILDNAGGISPSALEHIFEPYFSTKSDEKGTGLGLYLTQLIIVQNFGGSLTAYNKADGACFEIKLNACGFDTHE